MRDTLFGALHALIRADDRRRLAAEIKAWRDKNDFARSPDWWQAIDEILDIVEPPEGVTGR